jgi:hypothetical protein
MLNKKTMERSEIEEIFFLTFLKILGSRIFCKIIYKKIHFEQAKRMKRSCIEKLS